LKPEKCVFVKKFNKSLKKGKNMFSLPTSNEIQKKTIDFTNSMIDLKAEGFEKYMKAVDIFTNSMYTTYTKKSTEMMYEFAKNAKETVTNQSKTWSLGGHYK
jgi:predicted transcriptional regulator